MKSTSHILLLMAFLWAPAVEVLGACETKLVTARSHQRVDPENAKTLRLDALAAQLAKFRRTPFVDEKNMLNLLSHLDLDPQAIHETQKIMQGVQKLTDVREHFEFLDDQRRIFEQALVGGPLGGITHRVFSLVMAHDGYFQGHDSASVFASFFYLTDPAQKRAPKWIYRKFAKAIDTTNKVIENLMESENPLLRYWGERLASLKDDQLFLQPYKKPIQQRIFEKAVPGVLQYFFTPKGWEEREEKEGRRLGENTLAWKREVNDILTFIDLYRSVLAAAEASGLPWSYVHIDATEGPAYVKADKVYHPILKFEKPRTEVVPNSFNLGPGRRLGVPMGSNGRGKTTFFELADNIALAQSVGIVFSPSMTMRPMALVGDHSILKKRGNGLSDFQNQMTGLAELLNNIDSWGRVFVVLDEPGNASDEHTEFGIVAAVIEELAGRPNLLGLMPTHSLDVPEFVKSHGIENVFFLHVTHDPEDAFKMLEGPIDPQQMEKQIRRNIEVVGGEAGLPSGFIQRASRYATTHFHESKAAKGAK